MLRRVASLNVISPDTIDLFFGPVARCAVLHRAGSLTELRAVLEGRLAGTQAPCTLDLIGHSTRDHHLLRLGDEAVDMLNPFAARFFRTLAADCLLPRLGVTAVRLLGCETAVSPGGQRTLRLLARTLRLPVFGTNRTLMKSHYDEHGFNPAFAHVLVEAAELN
jgi:hypothetical protein